MHAQIARGNLDNTKTTQPSNLSKIINIQQGTGLKIALYNKRERGNLRFCVLCCIRIFIASDGCISGELLSLAQMST